MKAKVLLIEDAKEYQLVLSAHLGKSYDLVIVENGRDAFERLKSERFDLALIDVVLPDMSGLQICNFIKSQNDLKKIPVILVTGNDSVDHKVEGLDSGADDYVTKPFNWKELEARIRARLRGDASGDKPLFLEGFEINSNKQRVYSIALGAELDFTPIEYKLFICLSRHLDHVMTRQQILDLVWPDKLNVSERTVDSHISNLRRKLAGSGIEISAVQGCGYRFSHTPSVAA